MEDLRGCWDIIKQWLMILAGLVLLIIVVINIVTGGDGWLENLILLVFDVVLFIFEKKSK